MEVQQQYGDQVTFVGVPGLASVSEMETFVAQRGVDGFNHIIDDGEIWDRFGVFEQRVYIFIDDDGTTRLATYGQLESDVQDLIDS